MITNSTSTLNITDIHIRDMNGQLLYIVPPFSELRVYRIGDSFYSSHMDSQLVVRKEAFENNIQHVNVEKDELEVKETFPAL